MDKNDLLNMKHYEVIEMVKEYLKELPSDDIRHDFIHSLNICVHCGSFHLPCYCHPIFDD